MRRYIMARLFKKCINGTEKLVRISYTDGTSDKNIYCVYETLEINGKVVKK